MKLGEKEELLLDLRPHPLAFASLYLVFSYLVLVSAYFGFFYEETHFSVIKAFLSGLSLKLVVMWVALVVPLTVYSLLKISWRWAILAVALAAISTVLELTGNQLWLPEVTVGIIGLSTTDLYRRAHHYYVTNKRIVTELRFLTIKSRELPISKINDLVVEIPILGRIFNFGHVIPLTASGLGSGQDLALAGTSIKISRFDVGVAGGRTVTVPRARTFLALYGVPDPEKVASVISNQFG